MTRSDFASILASMLDESASNQATTTPDFTNDNLHFAYVVEPNFTSRSDAHTSEATRIFSLDTDLFKLTEAVATEVKFSSQGRTFRGTSAYKAKSKNVTVQELPPWNLHSEWSARENLALTRLQNCIQEIRASRNILGPLSSETKPLPDNFTNLELKKTYRKLVLFSHPDRDTGDLSLFIQVKADYQTLMAFLEKIA